MNHFGHKGYNSEKKSKLKKNLCPHGDSIGRGSKATNQMQVGKTYIILDGDKF